MNQFFSIEPTITATFNWDVHSCFLFIKYKNYVSNKSQEDLFADEKVTASQIIKCLNTTQFLSYMDLNRWLDCYNWISYISLLWMCNPSWCHLRRWFGVCRFLIVLQTRNTTINSIKLFLPKNTKTQISTNIDNTCTIHRRSHLNNTISL